METRATDPTFESVLLRATNEATLEGVLVVSPDGRMISSNARFYAMWGIPDDVILTGSDDAAQRSVLGTLVDPEGFQRRVRELYTARLAARDELLLRDGRVFDRYGTPLTGEDGVYHGYAWFIRDVTEERRARQALAESEARYRSLVGVREHLARLAEAAADRTRALQLVTSALSSAVTTADVMTVILQQGSAGVGATGNGVATRDGDRVRYHVLNGYGPDIKATWAEFGMDRGSPVTHVLRTGEPLFIESREAVLEQFPSEQMREFIDASGEQSIARLPLHTSTGVVGVLTFGFDVPHHFRDDEREFLLALAGQCAQALERAQLYERERRTALLLQRSLLPERLPDLPGVRLAARCQPATPDVEVGGDWYDALALPDGRVAVAVGDVMGKGVRAASVMGQVRNALRGLVHADACPSRILEWLDAVVVQFEHDEEFVTLVYGVLDPLTGEFSWGCAGHPPPLLLSDDDALYVDDGGSLPLGLGGPRPIGRLTLGEGEALLLFSDGLVETRAQPLADGLPKLQDQARALLDYDELPPAEYLCDALVAGMLDVGADDDVTVLLMRREAPVPHPAAEAGGRQHVGDRSRPAPQHRFAEIELPARTTTPGAARRFVRRHLEDWGLEALCDAALLCVSELVTNAVVHASSAVQLRMRADTGRLRVEVRDTGPGSIPLQLHPTPDDIHGRGLFLVDAVTDRWGAQEELDGKRVWFELHPARRMSGSPGTVLVT